MKNFKMYLRFYRTCIKSGISPLHALLFIKHVSKTLKKGWNK